MCTAVVMIGVVAGCKEEEMETAENASVEPMPVSEPVAIPGKSNQPADPDAKVVTVNGESLTRGKLDKELSMIMSSPQFASMPAQQAGMMRQQMESRVVDRFVSQQLLSAAAEEADVEATDAEVDEFVDGIRENIPEGITLESVMKERGIDMDKLRDDVAADIKIRKLLESKTAAIPAASEEDVVAYYEGNKEMFSVPESVSASHVLVKVDKDADEETKAAAKAKLEGIRKQIADGELAFEAAASEHSDCPSGQRGGDLGTFSHGQMVRAFEEAAFTQEIDKLGPVIETPFGYHIVKVTEKQAAGERKLDEVKDEISDQLTMKQKQTVVQDYIEELRESADIEYAGK